MNARRIQNFPPVILINLHRAVEVREFFLEELEVRVDVAQLESDRLLQFLVRRRPVVRIVGECASMKSLTEKCTSRQQKFLLRGSELFLRHLNRNNLSHFASTKCCSHDFAL